MFLWKREQEEAELPVQLLQLAGADTSVLRKVQLNQNLQIDLQRSQH